jgi:hypothetical protein
MFPSIVITVSLIYDVALLQRKRRGYYAALTSFLRQMPCAALVQARSHSSARGQNFPGIVDILSPAQENSCAGYRLWAIFKRDRQFIVALPF